MEDLVPIETYGWTHDPLSVTVRTDLKPDGRTVSTLHKDGTVRLWDATKGRPIGLPLERPPENRAPRADDDDSLVSIRLSPDGRTALKYDHGIEVRLQDAATGRQLGPPLKHQAGVATAEFSPDGRTVLCGCNDGTAQLWDVAEWPDEWASDATLRIEAMTGLILDEQGEVALLDITQWSERLRQLASKGIPLSQPPRWSLDPIVNGPEPMARAKAWIERGRWAEAEAAFEEAVKAWPDDGRIRWERARFFARRAQVKEAGDEFAQALLRNVMPDEISAKLNSLSRANSSNDPRKDEESQNARAELSEEILADRSIADRVCALVPKELFEVLHPLVRARYWFDRMRWADAEAAYKQAIDEANQASGDNRGRTLIERGRFFAARSKARDAARDFVNAYVLLNNSGAELTEVSKAILGSPAIRDHALDFVKIYGDGYLTQFQEKVLDAVFPRDPFAR
jgi:tetratricopeptide (TPR) repeat protein